MTKLELNQPTLFLLYGFPGSGKTYFARQLCEDLKAAHIQADKIRNELFEQPRYDAAEDAIVKRVMNYMAEEFINSGVSVVLDENAARMPARRRVAAAAKKSGAALLLVWFQVDMESAFTRVIKRDRRRIDDRYAKKYDRTIFESDASEMQNPETNENYIVLSGKHTYQSQKGTVIKRLYDMGLLLSGQTHTAVAKPQLVNLVPNPLAGRVDPSRRNISIQES